MKVGHFLILPALLLPLPALAASLEIRGVVACQPGLVSFVWPTDSGHCLTAKPLLDDTDIVSAVPAAGTPWPYSVTIAYGDPAQKRLAAFAAESPDRRIAIYVNGIMAGAAFLAEHPAGHMDVMLEGDDMESDVLNALGGKRQ